MTNAELKWKNERDEQGRSLQRKIFDAETELNKAKRAYRDNGVWEMKLAGANQIGIIAYVPTEARDLIFNIVVAHMEGNIARLKREFAKL